MVEQLEDSNQKESQTRTVRGLKSKQFTQTNGEFKSTQSEPARVCRKSENGKRKRENGGN